jgi:hypothetical protein
MQNLIDEILKLSTKDKFPFYVKIVKTNIIIKIVNITRSGITYYGQEYIYKMPFSRFSKDTLIVIKNILIIKNNDLWND